MKSSVKLLLPLMLVASVGTFTSCSSSDDSSGEVQVPSGNVEANALAGVWNIENYTMTLYSNNTFDAVDNSTSKNYAGVYNYAGDVLSLSGVTTRAFTLEEGKTYTFEVKKEGNKIVLIDTETKQTYTGTFVSEAPQPTTEYLSPAQEKAYIETQARNFENYFNANEWEEYAELGKQVYEVRDGDLNAIESDFVKNTMTSSTTSRHDEYEWMGGNYSENGYWMGDIYKVYTLAITKEYWDECLMVSNMAGEFTAMNGKWVRTKTDGDLTFKFTSKDGAQWVLAVKKSGSTGAVYIDKDYEWDYSSWAPTIGSNDILVNKRDSVVKVADIFNTYYIDVPTHVTATLTRNGEERVKAVVNIDNFTNRDSSKKKLSLIGNSNGNASVYVKTLNEPFNVSTTFKYSDRNTTSFTAQITKGGKTLADMSAQCVPEAENSQALQNVTNINVRATVLGGLTADLTVSNFNEVADAFEQADENDTEESVVVNAKNRINNCISGYIVNTPSSKTKQAELAVNVMPYERNEWYYDYNAGEGRFKTVKFYELTPVLRFYDSSTYAFPDYFTEKFFRGVIDKARDIVRDFNDMIEN